MFILVARVQRNGAVCREYYNPTAPGGCVMAPLIGGDATDAKQYPTEEAARADIPKWIELLTQWYQNRGIEIDPDDFAQHMRDTVTVKNLEA